jgi:hypothetical protein
MLSRKKLDCRTEELSDLPMIQLAVFQSQADFCLVWSGASGAGSACAFGMMDHLSLKSWAAAEFIEVPDQARIVAMATTLSNARMDGPHEQ